MAAVRNVQETDLAWALIDVVGPQLSPSQRDVLFVVLGAGDSFGAIRRILETLVTASIPLIRDIATRCSAWLDSYACHELEQYLSRLLQGLAIEPRRHFSSGTPQAPTHPNRHLTQLGACLPGQPPTGDTTTRDASCAVQHPMLVSRQATASRPHRLGRRHRASAAGR